MAPDDAIQCQECGHVFDAERVRVYADQLQVPTMVLRGLLRSRGCGALGTHHLATGEPGPKRASAPPVKRTGNKRMRPHQSRTRRYRLGLVGDRWADSGDMLHALRDLRGKPRGWRP